VKNLGGKKFFSPEHFDFGRKENFFTGVGVCGWKENFFRLTC
jgi:acid phosphatase class B